MNVIEKVQSEQLRKDLVPFKVGDTIKVYSRIKEADRERVQAFSGIVINMQGRGIAETFTVRRISYGEGVERVFPLHSPFIQKIEVERAGKVRRAKLYYLRDRVGKRARVRERRYTGPEETIEPGLMHEPAGATDAEGMTADETVSEGVQAAQDGGDTVVGAESETPGADSPSPDAGDSQAAELAGDTPA